MRLSVQYALSTFGKTIPFAAADAFSLYFYTDIAGIAPNLAGTMVFGLLSWSALCDPLAGWLYQTRSAQKLGPRPYFLYGTAAMALFFVLGFCKPLSIGPPWLFFLAGGALFRFAYSLIDVPHNALLGLLQEFGHSTTRLGAIRLCATIAGTLAAIGAARYALGGSAENAVWRFTGFFIVTGLAGSILFFRFFPFAALGGRQAGEKRPARRPSSAGRIAYAASAALFASAVAATIINGMFSKDIVYIAKYVLHDPAWTIIGLTLFTVGKIAGIFCWTWLSERFGAVRTMKASFILIAMTGVGVAVAPPHFSYLGTALFFFGIGIAGTNITGWALMPDCAALFSSGNEPLFFGAFTAVNKIASGLSGAIIGYTLMLLGIGGSPVSPESQTRSLYWLVYVYPIAGALIGIVCIAFYRLPSLEKSRSS